MRRHSRGVPAPGQVVQSVYVLQSPFFGKNLELVEGLARRLDPRRSDITRRYRTSVGRARCLVMSKTRAFRTSFLRLAEAISVLARASFNYSIFIGFAIVEDKGIEPLTLGSQSQCSPAELIPQTLRPVDWRVARASLQDRRAVRSWIGLSKPNSGEERVESVDLAAMPSRAGGQD